jgi:hypothetical protein
VTHLGIKCADRFEKGMEAVLNDPVYKDRFSVDIVYTEETENSKKRHWQK